MNQIDVHLVDRFRADLDAAEFTSESLSNLWGADAAASLRRGHRVPAFRALASTCPLQTLARFLVLGSPVERDSLERALPTLGVDGAVQLGLAAVNSALAAGEPAMIRPLLEVRPYAFVDSRGVGSWWIISDLGEVATGRQLAENHVLGIGGASTTLSGLIIQAPIDSALDLGTGCGIQALHASRHARRVVATDISERALEIARLNAELNGVANIEFRLGNLFEPVAGEKFDQIISNPPFVITPRTSAVPSYEYRDGGMVGDALVAAVIAGVAEHLAEGGVAQLLGNWEYRGEGDALDRVRDWVDDAPRELDAWVIEREVQDAALYAETWIRDGGIRPGRAFDDLYRAWLDDFQTRDVRAVGFGYVTLRRPTTGQLVRLFERVTGALGHNPLGLGEHLSSCLAAVDWLLSRDDHDLAESKLVLARDVTEERHYWPGAEDPTVMTLHQGGGFGRSYPLDTALAACVGACDGELTVAAIIGALGQLLDADAATLGTNLLPSIRELLVTGFLSPGASPEA